jgi:hypothetical protein
MKEYDVKIHLSISPLSNITTRMLTNDMNKLLKAVEERDKRKGFNTFTLSSTGSGNTSMCFFLKDVTLVEFTEVNV